MRSAFLLFTALFFICTNAYAASKVAANNYQQLVLEVSINQQDTQQVVVFLQAANGDILASKADLQQWRFDLKDSYRPISYQNKIYYFLQLFPGLTYKIDHSKMTIYLTIPPKLLLGTQESTLDFQKTKVVLPSPGGYFNYDTSATTTTGQRQIGGIFEATGFNRFGVVSTNFLAQKTQTPDDIQNQITRLQTTFEHDDVDGMRSIRIGDTFNTPGMWGQSVDFGGVQFGTNFATQPNFVTSPLPSTKGVATLPTTVNLYVNNALVAQRNVPAGPFALTNIPVITGANNLNIVTTDLLGRQQVVSVPYYASSTLLKPGLQDYSVEAGFLRNNFGTDSNNYGQFMVSGTDTEGVTDRFTEQWHGELLRNQQSLGVGGNLLYSDWGVFNVATAASHASTGGAGGLALFGFQRQTVSSLSFNVNVQMTTAQFTQVGLQSGQSMPILQSQASVGMPLADGSSLGFTYTRQNNRGQPNASIFNASYSRTVFHDWSVSLSGFTNVGGENSKAAFLMLTRPIGEQTSLSVNGTAQQNANQAMLDLNRSLPMGDGYGYDLQTMQGQTQNYQGSVSAQDSTGTYVAQAQQQQGQQAYRVGASGGVAFLGGNAYLSREITSSFAVVQVPGFSNVPVYAYNQPVAKTNSKGNALVPNLLPYQNNSISIDPSSLPLNTTINSTQLYAVPYYQSGVLLRFPVKESRSATLTLMLPSGKPVPAGAVVNYAGHMDDQEYPVGEDGELYLTGLEIDNQFKAAWDNQSCTFSLHYPQTTNPLPDLGTVVCR
jgi:outer membrane usher protein